MLKRLMMSAVCAMCAVVAIAAPKVRWVPADADMVVVCAQDNEGIKALEKIYRDTAKAQGLDLDALSAESTKSLCADMPSFSKVLMATTADSPTATTGTATSFVLSVTLPKSATAFDDDAGNKGIEDLGIYCFVENAKLNATALAQAVKDLAAENADECTLTIEGDWTVISEKQDAEEIAEKEPQVKVAYRLMDGGVVWTLGIGDAAMKKADAILTGTAPGLPKETPYAIAFRDTIAQTKTSAMCGIVKNVTELLKRFLPEEEYAAMMMQTPMAKDVGAIILSGFAKADGTITMDLRADMGSATNAEQLRDLILGIKAMATMQLAQAQAQDPEAKVVMDFLGAVEISSKSKWLTIKLTLTAEKAIALVKFAQEMQAMQMTTCDDVIDDDDDLLELDDMDDDEAEALLKSL